MKQRIAICAGLVLIHIGVGVLAKLLHNQPLMNLVGGSIYWPLGLFEALGLPVFQLKGWYVPDVTPLGLGVVLALWVAIYWAIADMLVRLLGKRSRVA